MRPLARDCLWLAVAVLVPLIFLWNVYWAIRNGGSPSVLGVVILGLCMLGVGYVALGAWRRTSWHRRQRGM